MTSSMVIRPERRARTGFRLFGFLAFPGWWLASWQTKLANERLMENIGLGCLVRVVDGMQPRSNYHTYAMNRPQALCPHCGGKLSWGAKNPDARWFTLVCLNCGARAKISP